MAEQTPQQFARKLARLPPLVAGASSRGIQARALVTKRFLLAAAARRTKKVRPRWVQYRIVGDTAEVRLRGGLGHLVELGSHKHPDGWEESPRKAAAVLTPEGPRAHVMHPALRARPFWHEGIEASRKPGQKAYQSAIDSAIVSALR